ncbi:unnamed protein product, partial [Iphiclides podalirius]
MVLMTASSTNIKCHKILTNGNRPTLFELKSIPISRVVECLSHFGSVELPTAEAAFIWQSIVRHFKGVANIPDSVLMTLHWITPAISVSEYAKLTLGDIDVVRNFGFDYNLSNEQLLAIADRVRVHFAGKSPEDYTCFDLTALGTILCAFNGSEIQRIHASAYKEASEFIGQLKCGPEVMSSFAKLAAKPEAFGPPVNWSDDTIRVIGNVAKYLPKVAVDKSVARIGKNWTTE